jgi:hypothetical protein
LISSVQLDKGQGGGYNHLYLAWDEFPNRSV